MAATGEGGTRGVHAFGVSRKQRLHLTALLILLALLLTAIPLQAQSSGDNGDIDFDPGITQAEFEQFSRLVGQAIYATPVEPAGSRGLLGFDIGVMATAVPVDTNATYWTRSVTDDFTISDHVAVPRLVVSKGLSVVNIAVSYAKVPDTDISILGGSLDVPIINGGLVKPTLAVRGAYSTLQGVEELDLTTYGVELFLSKGFGPVTPYAAIGRARTDAEGRPFTGIPTGGAVPVEPLVDEFDSNRITVGVKISLLLPKFVIEATQGEERSYAAKVSFGF
ncbi:MAG TPA: hypothetical protein VEK57_06365 [Thermoanaerobaculia bacterium]|nr:hypothetical protein [Thermoanaerobaculia bacterium]